MNDADPIFSHQPQIVRRLSEEFEKITVITSQKQLSSFPPNVKVIISHWQQGHRFRSGMRFLWNFLKVLQKNHFNVVFSHMTEVQSSIVAPITKLLRIKHYLWYAHTSKSIFLLWSHFWLTGIITSTPGSCPIRSGRVHPIGQSIDVKQFYSDRAHFRPSTKFVHIGRFDASKNISEIIETILELRKINKELTLQIVGSPSHSQVANYANQVKEEFKSQVDDGWLSFKGSIPRSEIPTLLRDSDVFIHAFRGSLDKSIVEATVSGLPVVTVNPEYLSVFGAWSENQDEDSLAIELNSFFFRGAGNLENEISRRQKLAIAEHSLDHWIESLSYILIAK